jgi:hypothetical protein
VGSDGVCRLLPDGYHYLLDNRGKAYAVIRLRLWTADGILLLRDLYHTLESRSAPDLCAVDCPLGNSVGAIGWPEGPVVASLQGPAGWGLPPFSELLCPIQLGSRLGASRGVQGSYLVDSASSHMLVSKIKPCMSKYKQSIR